MRPTLLLLVALAACRQPSSAPANAPSESTTAARPERARGAEAATVVDAGTPAPTLTEAQLAAMDSYAGFSKDGLAFASAEMSPGAGVPMLTFYASPTDTVEKRLVLDSPASKQKAAADLAADGFPTPGEKPHLPPGMSAQVLDHAFAVTMVGRPAMKPVPAFPENPSLSASSATLVAVSPDGRYAAVRVVADGKVGEFGPASAVRVVRLFQ